MTRRFLSVVAPGGGSKAADAVVLVVSELDTNAVRHAGGVRGFRLEESMGMVAVAVQDASPIPPRPRPTDAGEPGGFGWYLVQELSVEVQVYVHSAGKTVTAAVPLPRGVTPQSEKPYSYRSSSLGIEQSSRPDEFGVVGP